MMDFPTSPPTHLILVCCHSIYNPPSPRSTTPNDPSNWLLSPLQSPSEVKTFTAHIQTGLSLLTKNSLLVFSGGATREETRLSEARSYLNYCTDANLLTPLPLYQQARHQQKQQRILLEEQALDSYHNVLLSLLLFWKHTRAWPECITIISHAFKRERFMDLHVPTLRLGEGYRTKVTFEGIDPDFMGEEGDSAREVREGDSAMEVREGERRNGVEAWRGDLYGKGEVLRVKRARRNFWGGSGVWFDEEEGDAYGERKACRVHSFIEEWVDKKTGKVVREEVLKEGERQPWE